jgi:hypothetical protein
MSVVIVHKGIETNTTTISFFVDVQMNQTALRDKVKVLVY